MGTDKTINMRPADPEGLHAPDVKHELVIGYGSHSTVIHFTDAELRELTDELAIYKLRYLV